MLESSQGMQVSKVAGELTSNQRYFDMLAEGRNELKEAGNSETIYQQLRNWEYEAYER